MGDLKDAIACAARMSKLSSFGLKEYPEGESWINTLIKKKRTDPAALIRSELGEENFRIYKQLQKIRELTGSVQARLPFEYIIN